MTVVMGSKCNVIKKVSLPVEKKSTTSLKHEVQCNSYFYFRAVTEIPQRNIVAKESSSINHGHSHRIDVTYTLPEGTGVHSCLVRPA